MCVIPMIWTGRVRISSMEGVRESVCYTYDMDRRVRVSSMEGVRECVLYL